jgi:N-acyl-D-aspartate/D-glutamate deacylase
MLSMTRVEAIPLPAMQDGMPWDWVSFPEFLDSVERTPKAMNILPYMPISPLLIWVMGLEDAKAGRNRPMRSTPRCAACWTRPWMRVLAAGPPSA